MTEREKIIELARSVSNSKGSSATPDLFGEGQITAFYRAAQKEAFEQAANECWRANEYGFHRTNGECEEAIRQLIKE